jgi:predicted DCC family thiol-disulfide oxidoreductase YuxK
MDTAHRHRVEPPPADNGWVLYDAACGVCNRWIPLWESTLNKRGFTIAPLQSPWIAKRNIISEHKLLYDLRLLLTDGNLIVGAEVYRYVMRRIWWAYPLYLLSITPILHAIFNWFYRTFANNRYRLSKACKLSAAPRD